MACVVSSSSRGLFAWDRGVVFSARGLCTLRAIDTGLLPRDRDITAEAHKEADDDVAGDVGGDGGPSALGGLRRAVAGLGRALGGAVARPPPPEAASGGGDAYRMEIERVEGEFGAEVAKRNARRAQEAEFDATVAAMSGGVAPVLADAAVLQRYATRGGSPVMLGVVRAGRALYRLTDSALSAFNTQTGALIWERAEPAGALCSFVLDGPRVLLGLADGSVEGLSTSTGNEEWTLTGHAGAVSHIASWRAAGLLVTGSADFSLRVLEHGSRRLKFALRDHTAPVTAMDIDEGRMRVLSGSAVGRVCCNDLTDGSLRWSWNRSPGIAAIAVNPVASTTLVGTIDHMVYCFENILGGAKWAVRHDDAVTAVVCSPTLGFVFSGGADKMLRCWRLKNGFAEWSVRRHRSSIASLVVDELRELVVSGDVEGAVVVWDATRGMSLTTILAFGPNRVVTTIGVDSRRSIVAYGSAGHAVACRAAGDLAPVWENPSAHGDYVRCVAVSENDGIVVSGGGDNTVHCWAITTGFLVWSAEGHYDDVTCIAIDRDRHVVVTGSMDTTIRAWHLTTGRALWKADRMDARGDAVAHAHEGAVANVAVDDESGVVVSCANDEAVRAWDEETGCVIWVSDQHNGPNGSLVVVSSAKLRPAIVRDLRGERAAPLAAGGARVEGESEAGTGFLSRAMRGSKRVKFAARVAVEPALLGGGAKPPGAADQKSVLFGSVPDSGSVLSGFNELEVGGFGRLKAALVGRWRDHGTAVVEDEYLGTPARDRVWSADVRGIQDVAGDGVAESKRGSAAAVSASAGRAAASGASRGSATPRAVATPAFDASRARTRLPSRPKTPVAPVSSRVLPELAMYNDDVRVNTASHPVKPPVVNVPGFGDEPFDIAFGVEIHRLVGGIVLVAYGRRIFALRLLDGATAWSHTAHSADVVGIRVLPHLGWAQSFGGTEVRRFYLIDGYEFVCPYVADGIVRDVVCAPCAAHGELMLVASTTSVHVMLLADRSSLRRIGFFASPINVFSARHDTLSGEVLDVYCGCDDGEVVSMELPQLLSRAVLATSHSIEREGTPLERRVGTEGPTVDFWTTTLLYALEALQLAAYASPSPPFAPIVGVWGSLYTYLLSPLATFGLEALLGWPIAFMLCCGLVGALWALLFVQRALNAWSFRSPGGDSRLGPSLVLHWYARFLVLLAALPVLNVLVGAFECNYTQHRGNTADPVTGDIIFSTFVLVWAKDSSVVCYKGGHGATAGGAAAALLVYVSLALRLVRAGYDAPALEAFALPCWWRRDIPPRARLGALPRLATHLWREIDGKYGMIAFVEKLVLVLAANALYRHPWIIGLINSGAAMTLLVAAHRYPSYSEPRAHDARLGARHFQLCLCLWGLASAAVVMGIAEVAEWLGGDSTVVARGLADRTSTWYPALEAGPFIAIVAGVIGWRVSDRVDQWLARLYAWPSCRRMGSARYRPAEQTLKGDANNIPVETLTLDVHMADGLWFFGG